jgi:hypothetical protein
LPAGCAVCHKQHHGSLLLHRFTFASFHL